MVLGTKERHQRFDDGCVYHSDQIFGADYVFGSYMALSQDSVDSTAVRVRSTIIHW